jgi:leucyl-tRNA synthetase
MINKTTINFNQQALTMEYQFSNIEKKWQSKWKENEAYKVPNESPKPKFYVLDMFPYPSGAGLHVGHPLGYIASDIYARYKRLKGFNVLHPMGYDSFGLPAEQYALETGQHPAVTTEKNIATFRSQLDKIGFCFDWSREVKTSDPNYYKWTQWIFLQIFDSWYNHKKEKAERISELVSILEKEGNTHHECPGNGALQFSASQWNGMTDKRQQEILMDYRLAFSSYGEVNWCEALGTVLANDEVINGVSERGGHPVIKKKMRQWYLRITEYANRLLEGLEQVAFSDSLKEQQRNWIGKSYGAEISFELLVTKQKDESSKLKTESSKLLVYTTRPDTIFGVDFMVLAPEHELVAQITTDGQKEAIDKYLQYVKSRSDRERMSKVKQITGCFTGTYAINPFDGRQIPVWIAEYVLAGYGTGAIMAVPCGDQRDYDFATHFNIPITNIIGEHYNGKEANPTKEAVLTNSSFLTGLVMKDAIEVALQKITEMGIGKRQINYKMRDAGFSRQRYWGEPFPIIWQDGVALPLDAEELPLELPHVDKYGPGPEGEGPLANVPSFTESPKGKRETSTMPGYAGSSWYFLRYMDPHNNEAFCDRKVSDYWNQVDLYIGGTEHAVGHLLYSRLWTKILYDLNYIGYDEPYKKLVNQGMIQGSSRIVYRVTHYNRDSNFSHINHMDGKVVLISKIYNDERNSAAGFPQRLISKLDSLVGINKTNSYALSVIAIHVDINFVDGVELDMNAFRNWRSEYKDAIFICEDGSISYPTGEGREGAYICSVEVEKMSKRLYNTVNPDVLCEKYGADTFRMYEMFLGPVEQSKPWDTKGIEGVHRFLKKLWRLFYDEQKGKVWNENKPTDAELKILHRTIKKIEEDTERFSFNTAVSAFMIAVNDLADAKCQKRAILEPLLVLLTPYAPHICEELWSLLGNAGSILDASYPLLEKSYLVETAKYYPVSVNGRTRTNMTIALDAEQEEVEKLVLANEVVQKWMEGKPARKIIYVKGKMVNVVV